MRLHLKMATFAVFNLTQFKVKKIKLLVALFLTGSFAVSKAQETEPAQISQPDTSRTSGKLVWSVGVSGTVIDDDGEAFNGLFDVSNTWNFLPYPTRLHVDVAFNDQFSLEGALTYSKLQSGKEMNDVILTEDHEFIAFDANAKYHFLKNAKVFDPYGLGGLGFTYRSAIAEQTPTFNLGLGANIWFVENFALNLQTSGKIKLNVTSSSYLMHSVGLVYRFN
jgi:OmpA-OmpF porin, OOP family